MNSRHVLQFPVALSAVLLGALSLPCRPALAAEAGAPAQSESAAPAAEAEAAKSRAQELFSQGNEAFRARRYKPAIDAFLAAHELYPSAAISFNLARAYERLNDAPAALRFYRDYLRLSPGATDAERIGQRIEKLEDALRERGVQQVTIRSTPAGATLLVDERAVGLTPWTGELAPGMHRLRLEHEGHTPQQETFELSPHRALDRELTLTAAPPPPPPEPAAPAVVEPAPPPPPLAAEPAAHSGGGSGVLPWIAFGAAGVALGGAAYFELASAAAEDDARRAPTQPKAADHIDTMHDAQTTARVLLGAGAALAVTGGVLFWLRSGPSEPARVALSCGGLGCDVWGTF